MKSAEGPAGGNAPDRCKPRVWWNQ